MIPKLDAIFAKQGLPHVLNSDNGPPFYKSEFKNFADFLGFKHRRITPYWPKANGKAERLVQALEINIRIWKSKIGNKSYTSSYLSAVPHLIPPPTCHPAKP